MSYQTNTRANNMNRTAKLAFFKARQRKGDVTRVAEDSGYTTRMVYYTISGERRVNDTIANAMYNVTRRRVKNRDLATA
jgi:hypothetical protein